MTRGTFVSVLACALLFSGPMALAQQSAQPIPTSLDEMIATALKASPEVLLAEAKLRQAQAELNQTRLKVTRDVVGAFNERKQKQISLTGSMQRLQEVQKASASGLVERSALEQARGQAGEAELGVAQTEADIRYLLGVGSQLDGSLLRLSVQGAEPRARAIARPGNVPEALTEALARPVSGPFVETNLQDLAKHLSDQARVAIILDAQNFSEPAESKISMALREPITLASVLQALADQHQYCFLLREYGIMVTVEDRARSIRAPSIPQDLPFEPDGR